jgi:hypothetical protein
MIALQRQEAERIASHLHERIAPHIKKSQPTLRFLVFGCFELSYRDAHCYLEVWIYPPFGYNAGCVCWYAMDRVAEKVWEEKSLYGAPLNALDHAVGYWLYREPQDG